MKQELIASMTGYKATDKNMMCNNYQFKLGEWHELPDDKPIVLCSWGFHFCKYPSGVWSYKSEAGTRVFKVEAEKIFKTPVEPGSDYKLVCYRIKLVEEIKIDGDRNTGDRNTGDWNTGDRNAGNWNTGYGNIGNFHAGFFCQKEEKVICFDVQTKYTRDQFEKRYRNLYNNLLQSLSSESEISFSKFSRLPGITKKKLKSLHEKHLSSKSTM